MSQGLSTSFIATFTDKVKHVYQKGSKLRPRVRVKAGVNGSTHRFDLMGKGIAQARTTQTDVTPMNIAHSNQTATLSDWVAPEYTDKFDDFKANVSEISELATTIAMAIGRREDQLIIDALEAASTSLTVSHDIGGTETNLNTAKCRRTKALLDDEGVPDEDRTLLISVSGLEALLGDSDANTFDKNVIKALYDGDISRWLGFNFVKMERRDEGGLTKDGSNDRTCFGFHQSALGIAIGMDFRTEVNYIPQKTSWLANGLFSAGAVHVDAAGIVEITTRET